MYLKRLYSEPIGLFEPITFVDGVNFIFGKKDNAGDPKESLNGIGKSTFLDLIDFCLLSSYRKSESSRLHLMHTFLQNYKVVLELEIENTNFVIRRGFKKPTQIEFGTPGNIAIFTYNDLKQKLCDLIFKDDSYGGKYSNTWLRKLLPFFIKIQRHKKERFLDPIQYIKEASIAELNQYHFFLMGIDNSLAYKNFNLQSELKRKEPAIKEVQRLVEDTYGLLNISDANNEINKLNREIEKLQKAIENFKLAEQYKDAEQEANNLTGTIKELWYQNFFDRKKIKAYRESFAFDKKISPIKIKNLYRELNELLAQGIKKTLEDAIKFRKQLSDSRKEFIEKEIESLGENIQEREKKLEELEGKRMRLFDFLSTREAVRDLTEAFYNLTKKRQLCSDLEAKLKTFNTLDVERLDLEKEEKGLEIEVKKFIELIQKEQVSVFSNIFSKIYNSIYPEHKDRSIFAITDKLKSDAKIEINITFPAMLSKGKNQGRILVYDLAVLFHTIETNKKCPRFLIHDGIFDGMDKAHFVALYNFLQNKTNIGRRFQYIVTINEEGTLSKNFGDADSVNPEKIEEKSIIVLTPSKKLFGKDF